MIRDIVSGSCITVRGNDIDTDRIIPARFMKVISFTGLGDFAFYDERYTANGDKKNHPFNTEAFANASILLVNKNFGCGSSREHAPQALHRAGIKAIVGESFAEIFEDNCSVMGIPVITVSSGDIDKLMSEIENNPKSKMKIDIKLKQILLNGNKYNFNIPESSRISLIKGTWDSTAALLNTRKKIISKSEELPYIHAFEK